MSGQGKQLSQTEAQALQILLDAQEQYPGLVNSYYSGLRAAQAFAAANASQNASETIVDDPQQCVVCFVTKQCCRTVFEQKIQKLTVEDVEKLKHSVCIDHSSQAPGTEASKAVVEGHVKTARDIIDLYRQPLQ